jgi:hypothetical protein
MNLEIGAEAAQFPEKENINGIAVAVYGAGRNDFDGEKSISRAIGGP